MRSLPILFFLSLSASVAMAMSAIDRLGISCPTGFQWYVCQASGFIGCCSVDPCRLSTGVCPLDKLGSAGFNGKDPEVFNLIGAQGCAQNQANVSNGLWYTCSANIPPFMGCCTSNPCGEGCPPDDLRSARMSHADNNPFADYQDQPAEDKGLSKGAIAGIAAGVGVLVVLALAIAVFFFLRKKKKASAAPPVPAKNDAYLSHHSNPHDPMSQFSPVPQSAHPSQHGSPYPFSPQVPVPGTDSPGYYFPGTPQPGQQMPGSPPYYPNTNIPILHPAHAAAMGKSPYETIATSNSPVSTHSHYNPPVVAAELPAMPDQPSRHSMILRAASTTTYKGSSGNGHSKRESAASRMTAPAEAHHTHNHQLAELGETQITAEMGDSTKRDPNSPR